MTTTHTLNVDFGAIGEPDHPFRIQIDSSGLSALIEEANLGVRVYELMNIRRPGDLRLYLQAGLVDGPARLRERIAGSRKQQTQCATQDESAAALLPFERFDTYFYDGGDDTDPEDYKWLRFRESDELHAFLDLLMQDVHIARHRLRFSRDALLKNELKMIEEGKHPYDYLEAKRWRKGLARTNLGKVQFDESFYLKAESLLADPKVNSVAWRGRADYRLLRMICNEQHQRAKKQKRDPRDAFQIHALAPEIVETRVWGTEATFYSEGIGYGDLFIEGNVITPQTKDLMETDDRAPGQYILAPTSALTIDGYSQSGEPGWTLYTRKSPFDSRQTGAKNAFYAGRSQSMALVFPEKERTVAIFAHERLVFIIGGKVDADWRKLARQLAQLQTRGMTVSVIQSVPSNVFVAAGCTEVVCLKPIDSMQEGPDFGPQSTEALKAADVVFVVAADEGMEKAIAEFLRKQRASRPPYVIALQCEGQSIASIATVSAAEHPAEWMEKAIR